MVSTTATVAPVPFAAAVAALTLFLLGVVRVCVRGYRATFGHRRNLAWRLSRLACGVTAEYVNALLGPATFCRAHDGLVERVHADRCAYVQTLWSDSQGLLRFAITATDRKFHPKFAVGVPGNVPGGLPITLGRSTFWQVGHEGMQAVELNLGARRLRYREEFYFGNPGLYQRYIVAFNDAGVGWDTVSNPHLTSAALGGPRVDWPGAELLRHPDVRRHREKLVINTFAVAAPGALSDAPPEVELGADLDLVRVLDLRQSWGQTFLRALGLSDDL